MSVREASQNPSGANEQSLSVEEAYDVMVGSSGFVVVAVFSEEREERIDYRYNPHRESFEHIFVAVEDVDEWKQAEVSEIVAYELIPDVHIEDLLQSAVGDRSDVAVYEYAESAFTQAAGFPETV
jgi:hypothetical protein